MKVYFYLVSCLIDSHRDSGQSSISALLPNPLPLPLNMYVLRKYAVIRKCVFSLLLPFRSFSFWAYLNLRKLGSLWWMFVVWLTHYFVLAFFGMLLQMLDRELKIFNLPIFFCLIQKIDHCLKVGPWFTIQLEVTQLSQKYNLSKYNLSKSTI